MLCRREYIRKICSWALFHKWLMVVSDWWTTDLSHIVTCNLGHYLLYSVQWTFWCLIMIIIWVGSDRVPWYCGLSWTSLWWQNNRSVWGIAGVTNMGHLRRAEFLKQQKLTLFFVFCCFTEWRYIVTVYTTIAEQQNKTKLSWLLHYGYIYTTAYFHADHGLSRLRHELSSLAWTLGSWVRIPLKAWMSVFFYSVFMLFCV
jgi:hypothetical protein